MARRVHYLEASAYIQKEFMTTQKQVFTVKRDGTVLMAGTESQVYAYMHEKPYSLDWAIRNEGYTIHLDQEDCSTEFLLGK